MNGTIEQSASTLTSVTNIYTFAVSMDIVLIRLVATIVNAKPDTPIIQHGQMLGLRALMLMSVFLISSIVKIDLTGVNHKTVS